MIPLLLAVAAAPDWPALLRTDARAFHDDIALNHPGPANRLDPGFAQRNDVWLKRALRRAAAVKDFPGYLFAMREYAARFDDGHVSVSPAHGSPTIAVEWPGFLTAYDADGGQIVRSRMDNAPVPLGARLLECDGQTAAALTARQVGAFRGEWSLPSQRVDHGWRLFVDTGNPFVKRPMRCTFRANGRVMRVTLTWRNMPDADWSHWVGPVTRGVPLAIGARQLPDGTRWFAMSDFDGDPASDTGKALTAMIAAMKADRVAIGGAPRIVFDLRSNGGGSSDWSNQIATILWGSDAVARADNSKTYVEWRVSPANIGFFRQLRAEREAAGTAPPPIRHYYTTVIDGMTAAKAAVKALWREPADAYKPDPGAHAAAALTPNTPVYFLTDQACASACLDAADLWKALGAIQIGKETSADTLYLDIRDDKLPSGMATAGLPMKVYRDRPRGSNQPLVPARPFPGDIRDTAALERWVATLPASRAG